MNPPNPLATSAEPANYPPWYPMWYAWPYPASTMAEDTIMEEREEFMISPIFNEHHQPKLRLARFLKPSVASIDVQPPFYNRPKVSSVPDICSSKVFFNGWRTPQKDWKAWVDSMHSLHQSTWKKAGIYHAVLNSSYEIMKKDDLILGLAEKWCHETKTFVFVWGEATITLEDMMVLGGYSVVGESILNPVENKESQTTLKKLTEARVEFSRSKSRKATHSSWLNTFKDSRNEIEHEAFLVLWLSRFVFPSSSTTVLRNAFPISVHLARGIRIALAPAVLATLYRGLSFLKAKKDVCAPLQLVQIWILERLPKLMQLVTNAGDSCKPRFARWDKNLQIDNVGSLLDCALESFSWRPYAASGIDNLLSSKIYQEKGRWVEVGDCLDEELESWVRCLRASELVGIGGSYIEQYLPHRVAMQFGMDQDIPGEVPRTNASPETVWRFYTRPIRDVEVCLPSKFYEPNVTARYFEWWNRSVGVQARSSPMGDDETLENFVEDESRTQGFKESVDGTKGLDESRREGSKQSVDGTKTLDESRTEGSKESVNDTKTSDVENFSSHEVTTLALELEARIRKLEEVFAHLKAKTLGHKSM